MSKPKNPSIDGKGKLRPPTVTASTQNQKPLFSLEHLRGDYCLSNCETNEQAAFANCLHKLSSLTWADIQRAPRHGSGCETISRTSIRPALPSFVTPEVNILAFRFSGTKPMIGFRKDRIFFVLFLDRNFTCYDHD